ncbi:PAS domain-containing sensor histidine kinase [Ancylomarina sp. DW003]|nr:PAS domain-containing sensor histidine kinase [Ancylomarina sp. DW003]MDE5423158.1 PAS domain-containing sensor histidine kinase [Ancylomarina sp. DW003]
MKLEKNLNEGDRIEKLEDEILELKQKLEIAQAGSVYNLAHSEIDGESDIYGVVDREFNLLSVNDKWAESQKSVGQSLIGQKCYSVFCDLDAPCKGCFLSDKKVGKLIWFFLQPNNNNETGNCKKNIISPHNEIESYELDLKETDLFYEQLFESTGDSLMILDCKGRLLKYTTKLCDLLSYSEDEFSELTIFDIDDPRNSLNFEERIIEIEKEKGAVFETDLIDKSGNLIPVECSSAPISYHNKLVFFITIRDISKRKIAQKELHESEIRFRSLVENATDLVMRFDREHRHVFVNTASLPVLGISPEEFIGKTHQEMGFPDDLCEFWEDEMDKVFESGISDIVDFSINVKGKEIYFEWQLIPEFDTEDEIPYLLAIARDVSKRTTSEKALEQALKTKDKFFSIIAHDLRNPFGSLRTLSECIHSNDDLTKEEVKEFAEIIHTSACQGYDLLENLLEWSRSQRGSLNWQPQEFDLVKLIELNINLVQANIHKKKINLSFESERSKYVFADKYMIDTIIRNLLANALKFTYYNGNVSLAVTDRDSHYCISVKDDGKGIDKENQKRLFELDNQYSSIGTAMETGTGLGLILCKEFTDANNGEIWVESEEGKGSCFSFTVPKK